MKKDKYNIKIKDLKEEERPREKLIKYGSSNLKISELIAVILVTGNKKEGVMSMASRLIKDYGEKSLLVEKEVKVLANKFNLSINKSCQLIASLELGKRFFQKNHNDNKIFFRSASDVFSYLFNMTYLKKEQLRGLYLNSQFQLIHDEVISIGTLSNNLIHPREIFKPAIFHSAAAVIVAHNHPSGNLNPSLNDIEITKKLISASKLLEIELLDHLIIANNKYKSIITKKYEKISTKIK